MPEYAVAVLCTNEDEVDLSIRFVRGECRGISVLRIPVGRASDFMLEDNPFNYAYSEDLSDFSVAEDEDYFIPLLLEAAQVQPGNLR